MSYLVVGVVIVASCTQGSSETAGPHETDISPPVNISLERAKRGYRDLTQPEGRPSPVPLETIDVADPRKVTPSRFVPSDALVNEVWPIAEAGGVPAQLLVTWKRNGSPPGEFGLLLWQHSSAPRGPWKVVYRVQHRPFTGIMRVGRPGHLRRKAAKVGGVFGISVGLGDLNGDSHGDVLTRELGSGSGGCTLFRVLANEGARVRQIRFENACEMEMEITRTGLLEITHATYGEGCENIHGCGRRIRLLRWTGTVWTQVSSIRCRFDCPGWDSAPS